MIKRLQSAASTLLHRSFATRLVLAIWIGLGAKLFSMLVFPIYYFGTPFLQGFLDGFRDGLSAAGHGSVAEHAALIPFVSMLVLAPIIENLIIPFIFWVFKKVPKRNIVAVAVITALGFWLHQSGSMRWTGAAFFFCYAVFYAKLLPVCRWPEAYFHTVIAHFVTNLIAVTFMLMPH